MAKTIAEHYTEELENWDQSLKFYATEMDHIESKLYEILTRNSVVGLAEKVNTYQLRLGNLSEKFDDLFESIEEQEAELITDGHLLEDALINFETEKLQSELRQKMKGVEKKFITVKYDCNNFLTQVLKN
jgi:predicted nuclease with TOPRIM domain